MSKLVVRLSGELRTITSLIATRCGLTSVKASRTCVPVCLARRGGVARTITLSIGRKPLRQTRRRVHRGKLRTRVRAELSGKFRTLRPKRIRSTIVTKVNNKLIVQVLARKTRIIQGLRRYVLRPRSRVRGIQTFLLRGKCRFLRRSVIYRSKGCCPVVGMEPPMTSATNRSARMGY